MFERKRIRCHWPVGRSTGWLRIAILLYPLLQNSSAVRSQAGEGTSEQKIEQPRIFVLQYGDTFFPLKHQNHTRQNQRLVTDELKYFGDRICSRKDAKGKRSATIRLFVSDSQEKRPFVVKYPKAGEGTVLPLFGTICRMGVVISDWDEREPNSDEPYLDHTELKLTTVPPESVGVRSVENLLTIPLNGNATRRMKDWHNDKYRIKVHEIKTDSGHKACQLEIVAAQIEQPPQSFVPLDKVKWPVVYEIKVTVRVGDTFEVPARYRIGENGKKEVVLPAEEFEVTDIVLPDSARKIMGWISLHPKLENWPARPKD